MQPTNPFWRNFRRLTATAFAGLSLMVGAQAVAEDDSKGTVHLAYVEWSSEVASANVMRALLEEAGFDVKTSALRSEERRVGKEWRTRGGAVQNVRDKER